MNVPCPSAAGRRSARPRRWTRSSTRPGTSCATATRTTTRRRSTARRRLLEPGRPLHRRRRPRDGAHDLRAVLGQGAERPGAARLPRAVRAVLLERLGDGREDEDVEAGRQHRRARRLPRALRRGRLPPEHPVPRAGERGHGVDRVERRGDVAVRQSAVAVVNEVVERAPDGPAEDGPLARKAHATIAKVTDDIGRRFAFNTAIAAVMELVNELSRDRAGRRLALRRRDRRRARPAVRPARRGGAVGTARARAAVGGAVAGRRPGDCSRSRPSRSSSR